jgi:hypothetical protein
MRRLIRKFRKSERGASIVEMAVVSPFLVFLSLGALDFSLCFYHYHLMSAGLRDGVRYLARVDDPAADQEKGKQIAIFGEIGGTVKRVSWWEVGNITFNMVAIANPIDGATGSPTYRGGDPIYKVRLATDINHPGVGFLPIMGITTPFRINIFHEERFIGD